MDKTQEKSAPGEHVVDRREVLTDAVKLAGAAAALSLLPVEGRADSGEAAAAAPAAIAEGKPAAENRNAPPESYDADAHHWAYVIDTTKCIGCGSCVAACKAENDVPDGFFRTWVERYAMTAESVHVESPNGGLDGFGPVHVAFEPTKAFFVPKMCNHCKATPCIQVCPVGASYCTPDGVVLVDQERCIGCGYCVQACPYGSRFLDHKVGHADKCTWCYHRITRGMQPACVEVCPTGTRIFGDLKHEGDPVREIVEKRRVGVLQPHLLTEPQCFYLELDKEVR